MAGQILLYYSNLLNKFFLLFVFFIISILFFYFYYFLTIKNINESDYIIRISKGDRIEEISDLILKDYNFLNKKFYLSYLIIWDKFFGKVNYGEFSIIINSNLNEITKIISKPSNVYYEFTVIDGWQSYQLNELIQRIFNNEYQIQYTEILADTYNYQSHNTYEDIYDFMKKFKKNYFYKHLNNKLFNEFNENEIMIISSLVEKEGMNDNDKRLISSVIFNRLRKKMKLQIDASTIFSITKGEYKFNRKLSLNDLNIKDQYNTYYIQGLPPTPICYVSRKTIEIVLENYNSEYLFYFYNDKLKKHIFSKSFFEHRKKLNKYRLNQ